MRYAPADVDGVVVVDLEPHADERGFFARSYDTTEFARYGMTADVAQCNVSFNHRAGTLRGLHLSLPGHPESKFVRCTRGAIVDVAVDVRPGSPTYLRQVMVELTADNRRALYLPPHVAHAFQTLVDDTEVLYMVSVPYAPGAETGFRHDDPAFELRWPRPVSVISDKDSSWAPFDAEANAAAFAAGAPA